MTFRLVKLKVATLVVLLQKCVVFEVFETNGALENLCLAQWFLQHLLVRVQCVSL